MRRAAGRAGPCGGGLLEAQDSLHLGKFRICVLEHGSALDQHVDPDPIADRHLVREPTKIELKLGDARLELVASPGQIHRGVPRRLWPPHSDRRRRGPVGSGSLLW